MPSQMMHNEYLQPLEVLVGSLGIALLYFLSQRRTKTTQLPLPPGPRRLPVIHNLLDLPKGFEPPHWAKHKELYGPISSVSVLGDLYIIVNDPQIAFDLLDKRSANYSDRPSFYYGGELCGLKGATTLRQYGNDLRLHRKEFARYIGSTNALNQYVSLEETETRRLLVRLLDEPGKLVDHIRTTTGAIILNISHGYTINPHSEDSLVRQADSALDIFSRTLVPGASITDIFPILAKLPTWVLGQKFHDRVKEYSTEVNTFLEKPFTFVRHQMKRGLAKPSLASSLLERNAAEEYEMKWIAATMYGGGADTTVHAITTFFLAMVIYPEVLLKAQEELDRVIGRDRLPEIADRPYLPYIEAIVKETFRWNNVVPMAVPHKISQDDTYMGYTLPKGALVLPNVWLMTHDPAVYPDPDEFKPERFLGDEPQPDPRQFAFGFGRRICPGKELADMSTYIAVALASAAFNIGRARDASGKEIIPVNECSPGIISHPMPFQYDIKPRDERAVTLIRSILDEHPFDSSDAELLESL